MMTRGILQSLALTAVVVNLSSSNPASAVNRRDWTDCNQTAEPDRSIVACTKILDDQAETSKNHAGAYLGRGRAYSAKREFDRAIADYNEAISLEPEIAQPYLSRGIAYQAQHEFDQAIADYEQALRINPNSAAAYNNRGNVYRDKGDLDRAIADYDQAIKLNPN